MWNLKKYNKLVNITKTKQTHRYREQTSGYQWGGVTGAIQGWEGEVQTTECKIGPRMHCTTQEI